MEYGRYPAGVREERIFSLGFMGMFIWVGR